MTKLLWEICGHENIVDYLKSAVIKGRLSHAFIFVGQSGLGKQAVADKLVKSLYCRSTGEYRPCGECPACRQVENNTYPDVYRVRREINEKTGKLYRDTVIDQIRDLKFKLAQSTLLSGYKVAVIEEAETLNDEAANSLLKVLEEPTAKTIIILIASDISYLPATVASRCQVLRFLPVKRETIADYLVSRQVAEDKAKRISRLSLGRPGRAVNLAEDAKYLDETQKQFDDFLRLWQSGLADRLQSQENLLDWEKDEGLNIIKFQALLENWQTAVRDLVHVGIGDESALANIKAIKEVGDGSRADWSRLVAASEILRQAPRLLASNISSKNVLENVLMNL